MKKILLLFCVLPFLPTFGQAQFWKQHWQTENYQFTGSGGDALTVINTDCEEGFVVVTDPINAPLPSTSPIIINPKDANGDDLTNISGFPLQFTIRVRSAAEVEISTLFRSEDGTTSFRTNRVSSIIPAGLDQWTEITLEIAGTDVGGFNSSNLRDIWFYLDRGTENFAGNEIYIDYISIGGSPSPSLESPCLLEELEMEVDTLLFAEYFNHNEQGTISTTSTAGQVTTFDLDKDCETLRLSVTDTANAPLSAFNAYLVNPKGENGEDLVDFTGGVNVTMRVRSLAAVNVDVLFRSGGGGSSERSDRKSFLVPAGLGEWTTFTLSFDSTEYAGFNPADLRDMWFYLDRGTPNFAGNEFYIDHIAIGGKPDENLNSPCKENEEEPVVKTFIEYFQDTTFQSVNTSSTAGAVTTFTLDTLCETLKLSITDSINAPLSAFNAYLVNPKGENGEDLVDFTGGVNVTMRVRSLAAVNVDVLFRSGDGGSSERSDRKSFLVPAGLGEWTSFTLSFDSTEYAGFNPADLRDMWFYLDRGTPNFAGNEFYIDHIAISGMPDEALNSPCTLGGSGPVANTFAEYFQDTTLMSVNTTSTAGAVTTFTLDTLCETLQLSVTDPLTAPLPSFNAIFINPFDENGNEITNIAGNVNVTMRVRSVAAITIDVLFRSGGGTQEERTDRKSVVIPEGLEEWTTFTLEFSQADLAGFNPADLRDMWFYLDRGTPNFAGNEFYIDHITIGETPDSSRFSPCSLEEQDQAQAWIENWDTNTPAMLGGVETAKLTLSTTECEELKIEVTDPENNPHLAFRPIVINPMAISGSPITNIKDNVQVTIRARSAAAVPIGVLFRSGDGSSDFRTATLTQDVQGTLEAWTTLTYTFTEADLGGFNPEDLVDFWIFLDQDNNNFAGNEIYFDYIAIGEQPDSTFKSPCDLPDFTSSTYELDWVSFYEVYPNPVQDQLQVKFDRNLGSQEAMVLRLFNSSGQTLLQQALPRWNEQLTLDVSYLPKGLMFLQISGEQYHFTTRIVKQ